MLIYLFVAILIKICTAIGAFLNILHTIRWNKRVATYYNSLDLTHQFLFLNRNRLATDHFAKKLEAKTVLVQADF